MRHERLEHLFGSPGRDPGCDSGFSQLDRYCEARDPVFALGGECERGRDVMTLLKGPICHSGFKRLN